MAITGFWHGGVTVSDMETSRNFYRHLLGLTQVSDRLVDEESVLAVTHAQVAGVRVCMLQVPGEPVYVELIQYGDGAAARRADHEPSTAGHGHLCFYVDDLRSMWRDLQAAGVESVSDGPVDLSERIAGTWCIYLRDPDGYLIELFQGPRYPQRTPIEGE